MNKSMLFKICRLLFLVIIIIAARTVLFKSFRDFFAFDVGSTYETKGKVIIANKNSSTDGISYQCDIEFIADNKKYLFSELLSDYSNEKLNAGDSVNVLYVRSNPQIATVNAKSYRISFLAADIAMLGFLIYFIVSLFRNHR